MNAERKRFAHGGAVMFPGQALLIEAMSSFVDATEQAGGEILFEDARRDAYVRRVEGRGKGVGREIQSSPVEVVPHGLKDQFSERELLPFVVGLKQDPVIRR